MKVILFTSDNVRSCKEAQEVWWKLERSIPSNHDVDLQKIDTDYHHEIAHMYNVRSVPTIIMEQGPIGSGMLTQRYVGIIDLRSLLQRIFTHNPKIND